MCRSIDYPLSSNNYCYLVLQQMAGQNDYFRQKFLSYCFDNKLSFNARLFKKINATVFGVSTVFGGILTIFIFRPALF